MYIYEKLDRQRKQIRLLTLQPGSGNAILSCTIAIAFLDTPTLPHYETISYVCGDQTIKATITLHGSQFNVPATAEAALRRLRRTDRPRVLWIDAICIDQENIAERGHQVSIMYEVYSKTSHNCVYLGPDNGNMTKVVQSMDAILREISVASRGYADADAVLLEPQRRDEKPDVPFAIDIAQSGLLEFFENPWFTRLWVVQEASLSRISTCYSGQVHLPLGGVLRVAAWLILKWHQLPVRTTEAQIHGIANAAHMLFAARSHYRVRWTMWGFLAKFAGLESSDRRDAVFALIALWQMYSQTSVLPATLKPEYTLSVSEVFTNACKFAIQETSDLSLLQEVCASPTGKEDESWPSWVPVLDRKVYDDRCPWKLRGGFKADNRSHMRLLNCTVGSDALEVAGVLVDEVTHVTSTPTRFSASAINNLIASTEGLRAQTSWVDDLRGGSETRASLVLQGGGLYNTTRVTDQEALQGLQSFKSHVKDHDSLPPFVSRLGPNASDNERVAAYYLEALRDATWRRAVFNTKDGHLGLGPEYTQPGDILAILYGCQWPVVMRPLPTPGEYTFLECSYVYGIMDGEAVLRHKELGREDDIFRII